VIALVINPFSRNSDAILSIFRIISLVFAKRLFVLNGAYERIATAKEKKNETKGKQGNVWSKEQDRNRASASYNAMVNH
jgi:hypothetical protein